MHSANPFLDFLAGLQLNQKNLQVARQQQLAGSEAGGQLGRFHFT